MINKISISLTIALALVMTACGTSKKAATTTESNSATTTTATTTGQTTFNAVVSTLGDWQTMQTGGNITLQAGSKFSSSIQMRMVRGEAIYISLRPMLGIEVGRLLITADSLYAVDKVHKRYIAEKVSLLTAGIPVTVNEVQDIFLGRPFIIGQGTLGATMENMVIESNGTTLTAKEHYKGYGYAFAYDKSSRIVSLNIVPQGSATAAYQVKYSNVKSTTAGNIAHGINVNANIDKKKINFSLTYKNIHWNEGVKIDRSLPTGYKRMNAKDLFSLFSN